MPDILQAATQQMDWAAARQKTLAQNVTNADTPGYRPRDIKPMDFKKLLSSSTSKLSLSGTNVGLSTTNNKHMTLGGGAGNTPNAKTAQQTYETSPSGNSSILEEQLFKMQETMITHSKASGIYESSMGMLKKSINNR